MTHDYTAKAKRLGHDCTFTPIYEGMRGIMTGWGPKGGPQIEVGDFLLLQNGDKDTRYKVVSIKYHRDPLDMWSATVEFAPREERAT